MAKLAKIEVSITKRYWFWSMVAVGNFAIDLGADEDKICEWIAKYGVKVEVV